MNPKEIVIKAIFEATDEVNETLPPDRQLSKSVDTVLFGKGGRLDSMGLVNLIVATEEKIQDALKVSLILANEKALSQQNSPFSTVNTLTEYILKLLKEEGHG